MTTHASPASTRSAGWKLTRSTPLFLVVVAAAGCSSNDDGGGGTTSGAPAGCAEAAALKDSVTALTEVSPVNDGLDALKSAATEVQTDLDATVSAVSSELQPSVDEVKSSFDDLQSTLGGISDAASLGAAATEVGTELTQLGTALTGLSTAIDQDC